jgi:hypothetical protein
MREVSRGGNAQDPEGDTPVAQSAFAEVVTRDPDAGLRFVIGASEGSEPGLAVLGCEIEQVDTSLVAA